MYGIGEKRKDFITVDVLNCSGKFPCAIKEIDIKESVSNHLLIYCSSV